MSNRNVTQLLTLMDGIKTSGNIAFIAATNMPNSIDAALRRPGRFEKEVFIKPPQVEHRYFILESLLRHIELGPSVDLTWLSQESIGYVAADLASLCREASLVASQGSRCLEMSDFIAAMKIMGMPSTLRSLGMFVPPSSWDAIGGLNSVKKKIQRLIEWPKLHKGSFMKLGLKPPQGILFYGPPGCSKTTLVKVWHFI